MKRGAGVFGKEKKDLLLLLFEKYASATPARGDQIRNGKT